MRRILFIGNFLSKIQGTIGPTELMAKRFSKAGLDVITASKINNKLLRLTDMIIKTLLFRYEVVSIDVYSSLALRFALITSAIASMRHKKIVLILHGGGLVDAYKHKNKILGRLFSKASEIVTPSRYLQNFFETVSDYKITYIPNTIDLTIFRRKNQFKETKRRILWVRAFTSNYNPDIAVKTLFEVLKKYPDATLTMIGPDKGNLSEIKTLISDLGLESKINITGRIDNSRLPEYYNNHDIYLNTTSYESFGVALIEAAACGLPIVSSSVGEIPLMWNNDTDILLSDSLDSKSLAKKIEMLFENRDIYNKIAKNSYKKAQTYSWNYVSAKWYEIFSIK